MSLNFISDRSGPLPKFKKPALAKICPKLAGVLHNFFPKMYIIILENEGFWAIKVKIFQICMSVAGNFSLKCVPGLIVNTNLKSFHHLQCFIFS